MAGEKFLAGPQLLFVRPHLALVYPCSGQLPIGPKASDVKLSLKVFRCKGNLVTIGRLN